MFVTGNQNLSPGGSETFTLDRDELVTILTGVGDGYFETKERWDKVIVTYALAPDDIPMRGKERVLLVFEDTDTAELSFSSTVMLGTFLIRDIVIIDNDHGRLRLGASNLPSHPSYNVIVS